MLYRPPPPKIAGQENTLNKINWKPFAILINEIFVSYTSTKNELSPSPTNVFFLFNAEHLLFLHQHQITWWKAVSKLNNGRTIQTMAQFLISAIVTTKCMRPSCDIKCYRQYIFIFIVILYFVCDNKLKCFRVMFYTTYRYSDYSFQNQMRDICLEGLNRRFLS